MYNQEELNRLISEWEEKRMAVADPAEKKRCEIALKDLYELRDQYSGNENSSQTSHRKSDMVGPAIYQEPPPAKKISKGAKKSIPVFSETATQEASNDVQEPSIGMNRMLIRRSVYVAIALVVTFATLALSGTLGEISFMNGEKEKPASPVISTETNQLDDVSPLSSVSSPADSQDVSPVNRGEKKRGMVLYLVSALSGIVAIVYNIFKIVGLVQKR